MTLSILKPFDNELLWAAGMRGEEACGLHWCLLLMPVALKSHTTARQVWVDENKKIIIRSPFAFPVLDAER